MFQQNVTLGPGTGTFASHTLEILIMLLGAFLLGMWLGWVLWNRFKQEADRLKMENEGLQAGMNNLSAEMNALKGRFATLDNERADLSARLQISDDENTELRTRLNELTLNITELSTENRRLNTALGLDTGEAVTIAHIAAATDEPTSDEATEKTQAPPPVVTDVPEIAKPDPGITITLEMHPPTSTVVVEDQPADRKDAEEETFVPVMEDHHPEFQLGELVVNENEVPTITDHFSDEAFEALTRNGYATANEETGDPDPVVVPVLTPLQQDDLKIVEGIGPKIEQLLFKAGIHTYSELAAAPVARIKEILTEAGPRYAMHDPGTWSAQALLAANGEWENLKAYQEFLDAGKRPTS